jgi:RNA-directed DNA polymerase
MMGVVEFDIQGLFDNLSHELMMKAVRKHTQEASYLYPQLEIAPTSSKAMK